MVPCRPGPLVTMPGGRLCECEPPHTPRSLPPSSGHGLALLSVLTTVVRAVSIQRSFFRPRSKHLPSL